MKLPAGLIKQFTEQGVALSLSLSIEGFDKCLMLYPKQFGIKSVRSRYPSISTIRNSVSFALLLSWSNQYHCGCRSWIDTKSLADHAGLQKEIVLFAYLNQGQIGDAQTYYNGLAKEPTNFSDLAGKCLGRNLSPPSIHSLRNIISRPWFGRPSKVWTSNPMDVDVTFKRRRVIRVRSLVGSATKVDWSLLTRTKNAIPAIRSMIPSIYINPF